jgi:hypothetical protein
MATRTHTIDVPHTTWDAAAARASEEGTDLSSLITRLLQDYLSVVPDDQLPSAYHRLYDLWWNQSATLDSDRPGLSYMADAEIVELDAAAEAIEALLVQTRGET